MNLTRRRDISPFRSLGLSIYLPSTLMAVAQMAMLVVLPLYIIELGQGLSVAAFVFAMRGLGSVLVNVPASLVIARHGHKTGMVIGNALMAASAVTIAVSASTGVVAVATLVFGGGMGTWLLARLSYITERVPNHQRGTSLAGLAGLQRFGMLVGPLLGGFGAERFGYALVFLVIGALALTTMVVVGRFASVTTSDLAQGSGQPPAHHQTPAFSGLLTVVPTILARHRQVFLGAGVFTFCLQLVREQRRLLVVLWGTAIGVEVDAIGLIVSSASVVDMAMFPVAGYVMDHWGRKVAGVGCITMLGGALGLLPFTETTLPYLGVAALAALGNGLGSGIILTMGADLSPAHERSQFLGVWRMVGDTGALIGPLLTAIVGSLVVALGVSSLIGLTGGLLLWCKARETLAREPHTPVDRSGTGLPNQTQAM
ncbi:MAG: MFS transporter [Acidobacteriota bacterium]|nr:MFS transporter [Acidobacteriota bacterium]